MKINVNVNDREVKAAISKLVNEKPGEVKKVVAKTAMSIEGSSIARTPVDTGNLKNSHNVNFSEGGLTAEISNSAEYAIYVEMGTRKMRAQPFLFPSWEEHIPGFIQDLKNELRKL